MTVRTQSKVYRQLEMIRARAVSTITELGRVELGQVFTPVALARELAGFFTAWDNDIRLLDPGAGAGTLAAVAAVTACESQVRPSRIEVTAYELDTSMVDFAEASLGLAADRCHSEGIAFEFEIRVGDFLEYAADEFTGLFSGNRRYTHAILNPPYGKIGKDSVARKQAERLGAPVPNMYAAFMLGALAGLRPGGEMVAITPRSFCNGPYFRQFRRELLGAVKIEALKVFESRRSAFSDQAVLQENVITHLERADEGGDGALVRIESGDVGSVSIRREVPASNVVFPGDPQSVIHILDTDRAVRAAHFVQQLPNSLSNLGITVSTGPVVDFRNRQWLSDELSLDSVPLIYPAMLSEEGVVWPGSSTKKPLSIRCVDSTRPLLISVGTYVLVKRFTSKEERKRVVAGVLEPAHLPGFQCWGIENHLNYLHENGSGLEQGLARGLAAFLNHFIVDDYFRSFSGHTQVNATDIRSLKYPSIQRLEAIGQSRDPAANCDAWVSHQLQWLGRSDRAPEGPRREAAG